MHAQLVTAAPVRRFRAQVAWKVFLRNRHIDTVSFDPDMRREEVLRSLVDHDGYDPAIRIARK
jgi:hypothetical protein